MSAQVIPFRRSANDAEPAFMGKDQLKARWQAGRDVSDIRLLEQDAMRAVILAIRNGLPAATHRRIRGELRLGLSGAQLAENADSIEVFSSALEIWGRAR